MAVAAAGTERTADESAELVTSFVNTLDVHRDGMVFASILSVTLANCSTRWKRKDNCVGSAQRSGA